MPPVAFASIAEGETGPRSGVKKSPLNASFEGFKGLLGWSGYRPALVQSDTPPRVITSE